MLRALRPLVAAMVTLVLVVWGVALFWQGGSASLASLRASGPDDAADLLILGAAAVGAMLLAWLGLGVVLSTLAAAPGVVGRLAGAAAEHVAPALVRRVTAAVLGAALATATAPVAQADGTLPSPTLTASIGQTMTPPAPDPAFGVTSRPPVADAVPDPNRITSPAAAPDPGFGADLLPSPTAAATPTATTPPATSEQASTRKARMPPGLGPLGPAPHPVSPGAPSSTTVTVVRGDSLWVIAARHLGPQATRQQVAREWPRWYAANRSVIGPNPNLILVGQVLTVPSPGASS